MTEANPNSGVFGYHESGVDRTTRIALALPASQHTTSTPRSRLRLQPPNYIVNFVVNQARTKLE